MPSGSSLTPPQLRLHVLERGDRAGECGEFDQHDVAGADENARNEIDALL